MVADRWVRVVAVAALPVLAAVAWAARTGPPPPALRPSPSASQRESPPARSIPGEVAFSGEKAFAERTAPPPERAAATLPPATAARQPSPQKSARCGGLEARLISVGDDPEWTFASIASGPDEPARLTRVGDRVGSYRVAAIEWDKVWVQAGGPRCALELNPGFAALGDPSNAGDAPPPWQVPESIVAAIDKRSETEFRIERAAIGPIFEQGAALLGGVRLVPRQTETAEAAIEIETVPTDSLLERLGVQSGDLLIALNGAPCKTPRATLEALLSAREHERLLARIEREGTGFEIELRFQ